MSGLYDAYNSVEQAAAQLEDFATHLEGVLDTTNGCCDGSTEELRDTVSEVANGLRMVQSDLEYVL
jgi:molecular chaperone GrpE (heat shock protein)